MALARDTQGFRGHVTRHVACTSRGMLLNVLFVVTGVVGVVVVIIEVRDVVRRRKQ